MHSAVARKMLIFARRGAEARGILGINTPHFLGVYTTKNAS